MDEKPVLMIDNRNPFCCRIMQFIFKCGGSEKFTFLSLNSEESKKLLSQYHMPALSSCFMIFLEKGKIFMNAGAFLQSTRQLNGSVPIFYWYTLLPGNSINSMYGKVIASFPGEE